MDLVSPKPRTPPANWRAAKERLWPSARPVRAVIAPTTPEPEAWPEPEIHTAPFNFLKRPGWLAIVTLVALKHGVGVKDILSHNRRVPVAHARQEAMYLAQTHCRLSLPETGRLFNRDHTTALHSIRKIERLRASKASEAA